MVYENRLEKSNPKFDADYKEILKRLKSENKYLVAVNQSTMSHGSNLNINLLIEALSQMKDCISIHAAHETKHNNVFVYNFIPQLKVLKDAHCSINHGGIHTINECIHFKTPMLIYSGQQYDQNGCTARIANSECGVGKFLKNPSIKTIKADIEELLFNKKYKENLDRLHQSYVQSKVDRHLEIYIKSYLENT